MGKTPTVQSNRLRKNSSKLLVTCRIGEKYVQITTLVQAAEAKSHPVLSRIGLELGESKACHEKVTKLKKQFAVGHNTHAEQGNIWRIGKRKLLKLRSLNTQLIFSP